MGISSFDVVPSGPLLCLRPSKGQRISLPQRVFLYKGEEAALRRECGTQGREKQLNKPRARKKSYIVFHFLARDK